MKNNVMTVIRKQHKNASSNLENRFLFCNTFLLHIQYLHLKNDIEKPG